MRLDRFLAETTSLTRSTAKKALHQGLVTVNGEVVRKGDLQITDQEVRYQGQPLSLREPLYLMLNKPEGYISVTEGDIHPSVLNLVPSEWRESLHPAGRLDLDTTGLLLLTDDGQWSHRVTSPRKELGKIYRVWLAEDLDEAVIGQFAEGILLKGEAKPTRPATLEIVSPRDVRLQIHEGKYHQVKRMFAAVGNRVVKLHREQVGAIVLDPALEPGQWRHLTPEEVRSVEKGKA